MKEAISTEWIREMIEARDFGQLKQALCEMEIHDLAEMVASLPESDELAVAFRILPTETAAEIFGELDPDQQKTLVDSLSKDKVAEIITEMPPDDRTELLEEMPGKTTQRLMNYLRGKEKEIARDLLAYPEESIGRLMTPEYVAVRKDWTIERVLRQIRRVAESRETVHIMYVVDDDWKLLDEIYLEDVILADPKQPVESLMDDQGGSLNAGDDQEAAIEIFKKYDAVALPVIDSKGTLVGIVTHDDVMDLTEEEVTEDMQMMAGMGVMEESYFSASFFAMLRKRLPWLLLLLAAEVGAVMVLKGYQQLLAVLAMFMPLINASAGNTGNQIAGLMIRGFAVQEIQLKDWLRVLWRELARGLVMGTALGAMAAAVAYAFSLDNRVATAASVALAMIAAVSIANILGAMLPFFFKKVGADPAVTSGPLVACLMDISSILIFFSISSALLHAVT
jgi:magnesium transporter